MATTPITIRIPEAAELTGIKKHTIQKSFMARRPRGVPPPPPHVRVGRAIHILVADLPAWVASIGGVQPAPCESSPRMGRPTKAAKIAARQRGEG